MKKKYKTPMAEKVEFDYKESVVACLSPGQYQGQGQGQGQGDNQEQGTCEAGSSWWVDENANNTSNDPYWGC